MSNGSIIPVAFSISPYEGQIETLEETDVSPTLHRSASHAQLGESSPSEAPLKRTPSIHRSLSENILANTAVNKSKKVSTAQGPEGLLQKRRSLRRLGLAKHQATQQESEPQYTRSNFINGRDKVMDDVEYQPQNQKTGRMPARELKTRSVSGSITNFARQSWASASRSPSPSPSKRRARKDLDMSSKAGTDVSNSNDTLQEATNGGRKDHTNSMLRRNSILTKRSKRPLSSLLQGRGSISVEMPSVPPIPKSFSTDKLPSSSQESSTLKVAPTLPDSKSFEKLQILGADSPRKKDELWSAFRNLDAEYQKFQSRPGTLKTRIVRSALLPFLRAYVDHPSFSMLRPEDLDRRTVILNKWWTGLLEMLNGRHGESVSGNDRPAVLEAVTALMIRPEWTLNSLVVGGRPNKSLRASPKSRSTTSLGSTLTMSSDFLAESVYHNVRNIFTQNLLAQMAYVVDKMSMRNVAASVVSFCGKATAFAFFYCEGVADILVRLWGLPADTLRRVLVEYGVQRNTKLDSVSDKNSSIFPPYLQSLSFGSLHSLMKYLRSRPHVPIATAFIPWHGPWVGRWTGKDTDLFYVFTKFYTDLSSRFLPDDPSVVEMVTAPGWLLVQAQILSVLDNTLQRLNMESTVEQKGSSAITFDDMLGEADANATVLPLPAHGAVRSMSENRLILLLRDCLSGSATMTEKPQSMFAHSFSMILKAAARRTSVFDHNACFALCDILEEALVILTRYHQSSATAPAVIDWSFWIDVCKHMLQSQNSMTEVRLCAFLYAMWPTIIADPGRRQEICIDWILTKKTFHTQFNHWCPMVRAFFMRLLVWRLARVNTSKSDLDGSIIGALVERLQESWCQFLFDQESAGKSLVAAASTPAPGRRLLIMRNDVQPAPAGMFLSFEGVLSSSVSKTTLYQKQSLEDSKSRGRSGQGASGAESHGSFADGGKRRWNLLKSIMSSSSLPIGRSNPITFTHAYGADDARIANPRALHAETMNIRENGIGSSPPFRSLSFKFSLEWFDRESMPSSTERPLGPPKLPPLAAKATSSHVIEKLNDATRGVEDPTVRSSRYTGKALAEWAVLVMECENFFERRKGEGVPTDQMVETPTLGVEPFRK